jgi:dCTP deaminase
VTFQLPTDAQGVLPDQWLRRAVEEGVIGAGDYRVPDSSFQPASLDLRLGEVAYRLRCSFLPEGDSVEERLKQLTMGELDLRDGAVLEQNRPYLIPLIEDVRLPEGLRAKSNPRSSTGRLDIFTRVITDGGRTFDEIRPNYEGRLYLEVVSRSFTIWVRERHSLNQLRLVAGDARSSDEELAMLHEERPLLYLDGRAVPRARLLLSNGLFLSLDLRRSTARPVGYRAKKNSQLLDLTREFEYEPEEFWEDVESEPGDRLVLEPEEFYLLLSAEAVRIPPTHAAEMTAYDPTSGELRTHYAGFFDPGFGHDDSDLQRGTRAALEVRAHDVPFMIEQGQRVCRLVFERMLEPPSVLYGREVGSSYQGQEYTLSKHFKVQRPPSDQLQLGADRRYTQGDSRM